MQRLAVVDRLRPPDLPRRGSPSGGDDPDDEDQRGRPEHPGRVPDLEDERGNGPGRDTAEDADQREPGVREHELVLVLDHTGTSALLVTLCTFESTSAPKASGYSARPFTCAAITRHSTARAAMAAANVSRRPPRVLSRSGPNTGDHGERREREQEVQQHLRARLAGRRAEEQRVRERHRHEHVAGDADRVRERQPRERWERRRLEPGPCVRDHNLPGLPAESSPHAALTRPFRTPIAPAYHSAMHPDADNPAAGSPRYLDRELSWLEFNARVLALAENTSLPLLERAKFLAIFSSNLDEFFQVRVSGLEGAARSGHPSDVAGRHRPGRAAQRDPGARRRARDAAGRGVHQGRGARVAGGGRRVLRLGRSRRAARTHERVRRPDLPGAHAARRRPRAPVPVHLQPVAEPRGGRARRQHRRAAIRA